MATAEFTDRRRIKLDKLDLDIETGAIKALDHGAGDKPQVVNVVYGTGSPPSADSVPEGTLWLKYAP